MFKNIKVNGEEPLVEDILREINSGMWTIGYTGQSPERLKKHQEAWGTFDTIRSRPKAVPPTAITTVCPGLPGVRRK